MGLLNIIRKGIQLGLDLNLLFSDCTHSNQKGREWNFEMQPSARPFFTLEKNRDTLQQMGSKHIYIYIGKTW